MTTPDREEMPTEDRTASPLAASLSQMIIEWVDSARGRDWRGGLTNIIQRRLDRFQSPSCNAYEPMREALILAEKADRIHSKCQECEDGAQAPEACGDCFPSADDARVARRNVLKSLGVRMRDVDRARAIKAEPSICNCSQEDVHDYGPCGEDCRSLVVSTLPVNDRHHSGSDNERLRAISQLVAVANPGNWKDILLHIERISGDANQSVSDRQTSDDIGILREALKRLLASYCTAITVLGANQFAIDTDPVIREARAALKGVPQPATISNMEIVQQHASEADAFDLEAFIEGDNLEPGKLRPCPFCGGEAERIDFDEDDDEPENVGGSAITCKRCKCSTAVVFGYKETLFSSWNERAPANAQPTSEAGKLSQ